MSLRVHIEDTEQVSRFGSLLRGYASQRCILDEDVLRTYEKAEELFSQGIRGLKQQLAEAQSALQQAGDDNEGAAAARDRIDSIRARIDQLEQRLHEVSSAREAYESRADELQDEFSDRAELVGDALVSYIEALPIGGA